MSESELQLPQDGRIAYWPAAIDAHEATVLFNQLHHGLDWQCDQIFMFGKRILMKRKFVWIGDPGCTYRYAGIERAPNPWTSELLVIKKVMEHVANHSFNACLLNLYHNGDEGMGWHSDDEKELNCQAPIASLSLGATRKFAFRHKADKTTISLNLEHGSALIMYPPTQTYWSHSLLKTKRPVGPRINLTFRSVVPAPGNR